MRVLLIYPNVGCQIGFQYGLAHISSVLKEAGHEVELINVCEKLNACVEPAAIAARAAERKPDLIGVSIVTNQFPYSCDLARELRKACSAPIMCGGAHATMAPEETIATGLFDYVCVGEGEDAVLELVQALEGNGDPTAVRNIWSRSNGAIRRNPVRPFRDLATLPRMDYELFDFQNLIDAKQGWVGLMPTRGCPFRCGYCFNHAMIDLYKREAGNKPSDYIRRQPVPDLLDEIGWLLDSYERISTFIFDDDILTLDRDYLREFCEGYAARFDKPFVCNAHVRFFDDDMAQMLSDAGCWMVKFGLESGSDRVRREDMHRAMTNDAIAESFAAADRHRLQTSAFVMLGLPTETRDDLFATIDLLARIKPSRFRWSIFFPFPGTSLYDKVIATDMLDPERAAEQTNFMDDTCLRFAPEQVELIGRLRDFYPWFVNSRMDGEPAAAFRPLMERALTCPRHELPGIQEEGDRICAELAAKDIPHYVVKYNRFMAVRTDAPGL
jgi:anaerobic magnesium-protoporphyrin IX monomethyl ester cyclase